ncbi:MAG: amino acid ABC transporter substrate-binding protein [Azoarcus sp.]|nr:amino acid ABC transporter substrate-binding protein [Azoarcus sp.]
MNARKAAVLLVFAFCVATGFPPPETSTAEVISRNATNAAAHESGGTLEKAARHGTITIGYRPGNTPFSYRNSVRQPAGYAKELCDLIVEAIKVELGMPRLETLYRPVTAQERIPALQNGEIDLECGSTTITAEREKIVDFSITYFISNVRLLTRKVYRIKQLSDLAGRTIVFTTGTTAGKIIEEKLDVERNKITVLQKGAHADSFLMVKTGRAAAYVMDDILLAGLIANARDPNAYEIVGPPLSSERYGIMMRKGDARLKTIVNKTLTHIVASGEIEKLYERWFMRPIPPSGANMNLPMNAELTQFFAQLAHAHAAPAPAQDARR